MTASVVTEGEVTISTGDDEQLLGQMDSSVITADELRAVVNNTNRVATMPVNGLTRP
jgi:quercetin dioxygenase-like cupin family protein